MSDSYKLFLACFGVLVLAVLALPLLYQEQHNAQCHGCYAYREFQKTYEQFVSVGSVQGSNPAEYAAYDAWATYQDLQAQRKMSKWTTIMGLMAVVGTAVGVFGTYIVARTLHRLTEQNNLAKAANATQEQIGIAQVRAYCVLTKAEMNLHAITLAPSIRLAFTNTGQSPATDVSVQMRVYWGCNGQFHCKNTIYRVKVRALGSGKDDVFCEEMTASTMPKSIVQDWNNGNATIIVAGDIFFTDVFDKNRHARFHEVAYGHARFSHAWSELQGT